MRLAALEKAAAKANTTARVMPLPRPPHSRAGGGRSPTAGGARGVPLSEGGDEDRLDRMEAVFGLVEHDAGARLEDLTGHLQAGGHAGVLHDLPPDGGVGVVERGQAVHEL